MRPHEKPSVRWGLQALPRKRLTPTPEPCAVCREDIVAGQRYLRLSIGPVHAECRPDEQGGELSPKE
jgi:hypothetical protein